MELSKFYEESNLYGDMTGTRTGDANNPPISQKRRVKQSNKSDKKCTASQVAVIATFACLALLLAGVTALAVFSYIELRTLRTELGGTNKDIQLQLENNYNMDMQQFNESLVKVSQLMEYFATEVVALNTKLNKSQENVFDVRSALENNLTYVQANLTLQIESLQSSISVSSNATMTQLNILRADVSALNAANEATNTAYNDTVTQLISLQADVNTVNSDTMTQLISLQGNINALNTTDSVFTTRLTNLQESLSTANNVTTNELNSIRSLVNASIMDNDLLNNLNMETMIELSSLQNSVDNLNTSDTVFTTQLNDLQSLVEALNTTDTALSTQLSSLSAANIATTSQLNNLELSVNINNSATMAELNSLRYSVDILNTTNSDIETRLTNLTSLTTQVNFPYQNCIEETINCTTNQTEPAYWNLCATPLLTVDKPVSC